MAKVEEFRMSVQTRERFKQIFAVVSDAVQREIIEVLSDFAVEIEMHAKRKAMEELRQQWADTLGTMLR